MFENVEEEESTRHERFLDVVSKHTQLSKMRQIPAAALPQAVLSGNGHSCANGSVSNKANMPTLAAVSPKRVAGPCTKANGNP